MERSLIKLPLQKSGILWHKPSTFGRTFEIRGHGASSIRDRKLHKHTHKNHKWPSLLGPGEKYTLHRYDRWMHSHSRALFDGYVNEHPVFAAAYEQCVHTLRRNPEAFLTFLASWYE